MALDIKQSTATAILLGPFLDDSDGKTAETGLTVANIDVDVYKFSDTHALTKVDITPAASGSAHDMAHVANGYWSLELTATDTNTLGRMIVTANISGALPVWQEFNVLDGTKYDEKYSSTTPTVDVVKVSGDATAANNLELMYDGTGYAGGSTKLAVNTTLIEGSDATDQINAACDATIVTYNLDHLMHTAVASNADMTTEIPDGTVLSNLLTKTGDTSDYAYATDSMEAIGEDTDDILADTNELQSDDIPGSLSTLSGKVDAVDNFIDTEVAAIKAVTDAISTNGSGLTAIPWNSNWDAEVQSECEEALVAKGLDHLLAASVAGSDITDNSIIAKLVSKESTADWDDFANTTDSLQAIRDRGDAAWITATGFSTHTAANVRTEMDSNSTQLTNIVADTAELQTDNVPGLISTLSGKVDVIDGIVDDILLDTAEIGTGGAGLDDLGGMSSAMKAEINTEVDTAFTTQMPDSVAAHEAIPTREQALYMIVQILSEMAVSSTTMTVKKVDGSTSLMTFELSDATNPTSITRAT